MQHRVGSLMAAAVRSATARPDSAEGPQTGRFSPYLLYRRGTLGHRDLEELVPTGSWHLWEETRRLEADRQCWGDRLSEGLHGLIGRRPAEQRRELLELRRDIHNGRAPTFGRGRPALDSQLDALLDRWLSLTRAIDEHRTATADHYAAELEHGRTRLARIAGLESFQRGVQLSGRDVYREVAGYAAGSSSVERKASRRRRTECTITSYAYRIVFKPSPFGTFTEVGAAPFTVDQRSHRGAADPAGADARSVSRVRLSVGLLAWLEQLLGGVDQAEQVLRVRLNNSLMIRDDGLTYVRRPPEGARTGPAPEAVCTIRHPVARWLVEVLSGDGDLSQSQLQDRLVTRGLDADDAKATIDKLVDLGLCHRGLGLADQSDALLAVASARLRAAGSPQASTCADILARLGDIEEAYAAATAADRDAMLGELTELVHRFAALCGAPPPSAEALRALVYEDCATHAPALTWDAGLVRANRTSFELVQRLVPLLDEASVERCGMYEFVVGRFGERPAPVIDVFRAFAQLSAAEMSAIMSGIGCPEADLLRDLRADFFTQLNARAAAAADSPELVLDPGLLASTVEALPPFLTPWRSAAYRLQLGRGRAVINGITTGHGVFFSRFCDVLGPRADGWDLGAALRTHIERSTPRQTDLTAVLGLNFNLHPRLTPYELVYPASVAESKRGVLALPDLVVRPDPCGRRLDLCLTSDEQPIDLVPMNFLYPAAAPLLYRFLSVFAPTRTYRGGLWEQVDRHRRDRPRHRPRLILGDLVLDRRSWQLPGSELPNLAGVERMDLDALGAFDQWRHEAGLPQQSFFRLAAAPPAPGTRDLVSETARWALESRSARLHKPHFLDSRNPFLMRVFAKQALARPTDSVLLHECLPDVEQRHGRGPDRAEEFFVEFDLEAR